MINLVRRTSNNFLQHLKVVQSLKRNGLEIVKKRSYGNPTKIAPYDKGKISFIGNHE